MIALAIKIDNGKVGRFKLRIKNADSSELAHALAHLKVIERRVIDEFDKLTIIYDHDGDDDEKD